MDRLPIDDVLPEIVSRLKESRAVVVVAPPGAGKTTRVPPAILRAGVLGSAHPNVVMLQPRRIAARAMAERIGQEQGWKIGEEVGYQVRFEKRIGPKTRLRVLTEGILSRQLLVDPYLEGVGCVILDEFHERSLHSDLALAFLREIQQTVRADLLLVVMSATLEAEPVASFLGGVPIVRSEGRMYPVEISHRTGEGHLVDRVVGAVKDAVMEPGGDLLVFLPGAGEIARVQRELQGVVERENLLVIPLHGSLTGEDQSRALRPADRRKIVLATNIAETSLTINGITRVIDSGMARVAAYDAERGLDKLELKRISKASATQRAGRAGRTGPGRCLRLWSAGEDRNLEEFEKPDVTRVDLASTVLALHAWGAKDAREFGWYEKPDEEALEAAERLLIMLGAIRWKGASNGPADVIGWIGSGGVEITEVGRQLLRLPVHPRLGRLMLAAAEQGMVEEGAAIAALLEEKDFLISERGHGDGHRGKAQGESDLVGRLELLARAEREGFGGHLRQAGIDGGAARQVARARNELIRMVQSSDPMRKSKGIARGRESPGIAIPGRDDAALLRLPLWAYPDRVVRRRDNDAASGVMVGGGGVRLSEESIVWQPELYVALDARQDQRSKSREAVVRIASGIRLEDLQEMFPEAMRRERRVEFDEERGRAVMVDALYYYDLLIKENRQGAVDATMAVEALSAQVRQQARAIFAGHPGAANVLARVKLLRENMPEKAWPVFDDAELGELLASACAGKKSVEQIKQSALGELLKGQLAYPLDRVLEEQAPETIEVPSGSRIKIDYDAAVPVLAVRLQELFGWTDTPRIAGGRVGLVLYLLGPNYRPVQITNDLRSFWSKAYFEVRKDLRTRYPKHSWPEDPLTAKADAKGRRKL
jgi:ATP-dependent helicase HrpB